MKHLSMESGRSMMEIIGVLAIVGLLSVTGLYWYPKATRKNHINVLVYQMNLRLIDISSSLQNKVFNSKSEMDNFLTKYDFTEGQHHVSFHAPTDNDIYTGREYVADITDKSGNPIKGKECYDLMTTMLKQKTTTDMDFTVKNAYPDNTDSSDLTIRLNGKAINIHSICGND